VGYIILSTIHFSYYDYDYVFFFFINSEYNNKHYNLFTFCNVYCYYNNLVLEVVKIMSI